MQPGCLVRNIDVIPIYDLNPRHGTWETNCFADVPPRTVGIVLEVSKGRESWVKWFAHGQIGWSLHNCLVEIV